MGNIQTTSSCPVCPDCNLPIYNDLNWCSKTQKIKKIIPYKPWGANTTADEQTQWTSRDCNSKMCKIL